MDTIHMLLLSRTTETILKTIMQQCCFDSHSKAAEPHAVNSSNISPVSPYPRAFLYSCTFKTRTVKKRQRTTTTTKTSEQIERAMHECHRNKLSNISLSVQTERTCVLKHNTTKLKIKTKLLRQ